LINRGIQETTVNQHPLQRKSDRGHFGIVIHRNLRAVVLDVETAAHRAFVPHDFAQIGQGFAPYRSTAALYLWKAADAGKGKEADAAKGKAADAAKGAKNV